MYEAQGIKVALLESTIETQFATMLEQFRGGLKFVRIDADIASALKGDGDIDGKEDLKKLFEDACKNSDLNISFEAIKGSNVPALLNVSEESRRMDEMMRLYAIAENKDPAALPLDTTLIINTASPVIAKLSALSQSNPEHALRAAGYIYKLALLSYRHFSAEEMREFLTDSYAILESLQ
jgi:molecular chaperone HtpG